MSTMATISESAEHSSSTEYSDELTAGLAAGRWWAIMELSDPIPEDPEYGDFISGQWGETVEAGETSCPTSLKFSNASKKAHSQHSGISDATRKSTKEWRNKTTQGAPFSARSTQGAYVPASTKKRDLTSSMKFINASEKDHSQHADFSDTAGKTTPQWRQKMMQGAHVPARSTQGAPVPARSIQGAPVPARSTQGAAVPARSTQGAPVPARSTQGAPVPARSTQGAPVPARSTQGAPVPARSTQGAAVPARSTQGAAVPARSTQGAPVPARSTQGAPVPARSTQGAPVSARSTQGAPVPARSTQGEPVPARSTQGAPVPARSTQGAPVPARSTQGAPVPDSFEKGDLTSSPVFSNASKATRQWRKQRPGKYEEAELKTTKQRRQQTPNAPVPDRSTQGECILVRSQQDSPSTKKEDLTSSLVFSDASEKAQHSSFSDATTAMDQRRKWRQKKPQTAYVPAAPPKEAPVPKGSQQRGRLRIPEHLTKHLKKASFEAPMPIESLQRAPVAASKELTCYSHGAPMPDKIGARPKPKIPEPLRQELLQQKPQAFLQGPPKPDNISKRQKRKIPEPEMAPVCCPQGAPATDKISERRDPKNRELLRQHSHNAPVLVSSTNLRIPKQQSGQQQRQKNILKGVSVPATTPQRTLAPRCSPQQPPRCPEGPPKSRWSKRVCLWSTEASDNAGLSQAPPQKLCVELRRYNHPAPQITTSQPNRRTRNRRPRSQPTRKRALDSAGVDRSPPQKKQRMAIKVNNQQSDPGSLDQIDYLCSIFAKWCVISYI